MTDKDQIASLTEALRGRQEEVAKLAGQLARLQAAAPIQSGELAVETKETAVLLDAYGVACINRHTCGGDYGTQGKWVDAEDALLAHIKALARPAIPAPADAGELKLLAAAMAFAKEHIDGDALHEDDNTDDDLIKQSDERYNETKRLLCDAYLELHAHRGIFAPAQPKAATSAALPAPVPSDLLEDVRAFIENASQEHGYGYSRPANPHDFFPDFESCMPEEIEAHKAACEAYDKGEYTPERGSEWVGKCHILRAPWGIGSYTYRDAKAQALLDRLATAPAAPQAAQELTDAEIDAIAKEHSKSLGGWEWSGQIIEVNGSDEYDFARAIEQHLTAKKGAQ